MDNTDSIIQSAERHCKDHGTRLTEKRKQVLTGLIQSEMALSAYELIAEVKKKYNQDLAAMSVYRILEFLESEKLVHKLKLANKYVACEHISCDHAHGVSQFLICGQCSKVKEISLKPATMTELQTTVNKAGFKLISPQFEMNCICADCLAHAA
ncbi:Fur family transcriptional regulator [Cycloclasticus sp.]|jgi:Fur family zinc uptake transcriptional regulator|uniref:Fur family transcriptional regulator n=1 Tax=Cycloclasticus sp. TaxID=2024830 RepID=UPI000C0E884B|nr:Fur family transcriptional regulator [Cycloclasticus sp.]PHR49432.1 MAG: transcriptional repressor [Cycloclasticus sp.]